MDAETMLSSFTNLKDIGGVAPTRLVALARKLDGENFGEYFNRRDDGCEHAQCREQ